MPRVLGILGGMGPEATVDLMAKILAADTAEREQDRLRILIDCDPGVLDRNAAVSGDGSSPGPALAAMARGLVLAGAEGLLIACNTAHAWLPEVESAVEATVLSLIEAACDELARRRRDIRRVGLMAGRGCLEAGVYQNRFETRGWTSVIPPAAEQAAFMDALYRVKAGRIGEEERDVFRACARACMADGAEAVIAGCTEIPLALEPADVPVPLIDPASALAVRAVAWARAR